MEPSFVPSLTNSLFRTLEGFGLDVFLLAKHSENPASISPSPLSACPFAALDLDDFLLERLDLRSSSAPASFEREDFLLVSEIFDLTSSSVLVASIHPFTAFFTFTTLSFSSSSISVILFLPSSCINSLTRCTNSSNFANILSSTLSSASTLPAFSVFKRSSKRLVWFLNLCLVDLISLDKISIW